MFLHLSQLGFGFVGGFSNAMTRTAISAEPVNMKRDELWMYSNNILNFQESTTILNAWTKSLKTYWRHLVYFTQKFFFFLCNLLLVCPHAVYTSLFLSLFWKVLFYLYCLTLFRYFWSLPSFINIFCFISLCWFLRLVWYVILIISFHHILKCFSFFSIFSCCRNLFAYPSSLISHPGFAFLFRFF